MTSEYIVTLLIVSLCITTNYAETSDKQELPRYDEVRYLLFCRQVTIV